jgi:transcription antitermination factor NusG
MTPFWSVCRSEPNREAFACTHLSAAGFDVFLPKVKLARIGPLFPNYVFFFVSTIAWQVAGRTPGVHAVVKFGDAPAVCPAKEIDALKARLDENGIVRLPKALRIPIGAKVTARGGLISGLYAGQSARQREIILVAMLGRTNRVELKRGETVQVVGL